MKSVAIIILFAFACELVFGNVPNTTDFPCLVEHGVRLYSGDISRGIIGRAVAFKTESFEDCSIACALNPACYYFTFRQDRSDCYVKGQYGFNKEVNVNATSGGPCLTATSPPVTIE